MNKTDQETLLDNYETIKQLIDETKTILYMEAPKSYQQARSWLEDMEVALGNNRSTNPFLPSFWNTLTEIGLSDQPDKDDDDEEDDWEKPSINNEWNNAIKASKEQDDDADPEDEGPYSEVAYDLDTDPISSPSLNLSNAQLVEEVVATENKPLISISTSTHNSSYQNGIVKLSGDIEYYVGGKCHRVGGPAIERKNGDKYWYHEGLLHRIYGPAIELASGHKEWWVNGKLHRWDGSAIEHADKIITGKGYALYGHIFENQREWETAKMLWSLKSVGEKVLALPPAPTKVKLPVIYG